MRSPENEKNRKRAKLLELLINVFSYPSRPYLTEEEEEILKKSRKERDKSQLDREQELAE